MADLSTHQDTASAELSLQALLATIDRETALAVAHDEAFIKERASQTIRRKKPYISFLLGENEIALSIDSIQEIGVLPPVTPLPNLPLWVRGIVQIRGEILSVVDFQALFGFKDDQPPLHWSYVLFKQQDFKFCLQVNRISGIVNIDEQHDPLVPFSRETGEHLTRLAPYFKGVFTQDNRTICVLDYQQIGSSSLIRKWQQH